MSFTQYSNLSTVFFYCQDSHREHKHLHRHAVVLCAYGKLRDLLQHCIIHCVLHPYIVRAVLTLNADL